MRAGSRAFLRFCLVGVVGFLADAGLTLLLTQTLHVSPVPARVVAFVLAASVTWHLNHQFTFRSTAGVRSWLPYLVATSCGAAINVGVYSLWLRHFGDGPAEILAGVAIGSVSALAFNFAASRAILGRSVT
jgi:putative flippase GtrA